MLLLKKIVFVFALFNIIGTDSCTKSLKLIACPLKHTT